MCISPRSDRASGRSGHSGGPALNARGEVIGWAVKSFADLGPNGQLRPVEQLEAAVGMVLDKLVPARPADPNVRDRLHGQLTAGTYCMGEEAGIQGGANAGAKAGAEAGAQTGTEEHGGQKRRKRTKEDDQRDPRKATAKIKKHRSFVLLTKRNTGARQIKTTSQFCPFC